MQKQKMGQQMIQIQRQIVGTSKLVALCFLESFAALAFLCTKYTRQAYQKLARANLKSRTKRFVLDVIHKRFNGEKSSGDSGLWRKSILMGDKCEPLDFSGVIFYDCEGNIVPELPGTSPRGQIVVYQPPTVEK